MQRNTGGYQASWPRGLGRDPNTITRIQPNNPGRVFEDIIIMGSATGENYLARQAISGPTISQPEN
jgi:hypothetical protein